MTVFLNWISLALRAQNIELKLNMALAICRENKKYCYTSLIRHTDYMASKTEKISVYKIITYRYISQHIQCILPLYPFNDYMPAFLFCFLFFSICFCSSFLFIFFYFFLYLSVPLTCLLPSNVCINFN